MKHGIAKKSNNKNRNTSHTEIRRLVEQLFASNILASNRKRANKI